MCLILFAYKVSKAYPLVLAANRDEFYQRPTAPMHVWQNKPFIIAGKDLEQGGTWFGINRENGRFAALTNYRDPAALKAGTPSRGEIIVDYLQSKDETACHLEKLSKTAGSYNGFNLLLGSAENLYWFCNINNDTQKIEPGFHGLSNRLLDTPWPKVVSGKQHLEQAVQNGLSEKALFSALMDTNTPEDDLLPDTGVGIEWERILSPLFIQSPSYGTRSSTVMLVRKEGKIDITERTYQPGTPSNSSDLYFSLDLGVR